MGLKNHPSLPVFTLGAPEAAADFIFLYLVSNSKTEKAFHVPWYVLFVV